MEALTREQLEEWFAYKGPTDEERAAMTELQRDQDMRFRMMLQDLRWPVTKAGDVADVSYLAAIVAYHLVRCGWVPDTEKRVIKARKVVGRGIATGAVEWVGMDEPDDPLAGLENMTVKELAALTPQARAEAIRRLQPDMPNDLPMPDPSWKVKPNISIVDVPRDPFVGDQNA